MFYFPILAATSLFLNTVLSPSSTSAQSDIAILDILAGMFARLDYASGGHMSISFPREIAEYARILVSNSRDPRPEQDSLQRVSDLDQLFTLSTDMSVDDVCETSPAISKIHADLCQKQKLTNADFIDFGYEWRLVPSSYA